ncbi:helix-turn-helix transcriptional regulator [Burkholderia alba]|uniref:helix-turn-helix transcriptional regulator n=1 Tax=Burkholderia alba TaxID=2683677 RepID=UPI002B05CF1B|nr:helix-turn-helix transcriptional regulator [Burkholderia alba]
MTSTSLVPLFRFSTLDFPEKERFSAWVRDNHCHCRLQNGGSVAFDAQSTGAVLGPFILSGRSWVDRGRNAAYEVNRTERLIRADGQDFFRLSIVVSGRLLYRPASPQPAKAAGDLFIFDAAQANESRIEPGDMISLVVPRDFLPSRTAQWHGLTLSGGVALLLRDYLVSLFRNLPTLNRDDVPHIVKSTLHLITAAVDPTSDAVRQASIPIHDVLFDRVMRYVDAHLLEADLTPDRICRSVGVSRAKLYQLLDSHGGVMRQIQRKRLQRAYHVLADPNRSGVRMADVAWNHGFPSEKHFYRAFKERFGHTPSETLASLPRAELSLDEVALKHRLEQTNRSFGWTLPFGVFKS